MDSDSAHWPDEESLPDTEESELLIKTWEVPPKRELKLLLLSLSVDVPFRIFVDNLRDTDQGHKDKESKRQEEEPVGAIAILLSLIASTGRRGLPANQIAKGMCRLHRFGFKNRIVVKNRNKVLRWLKELAKIEILEHLEIPLKKGKRIYYRIGDRNRFSFVVHADSCEDVFARYPDLCETFTSSIYGIELPELAGLLCRRLYAAKLALSEKHVKDIDAEIDKICEGVFNDPCRTPKILYADPKAQ